MVLPPAREEDLIVVETPDEVLVYDEKNHRAHCLNRAAALVWRCCDGKTTAAEASAQLARELDLPHDARLVALALARLEAAGLLAQPASVAPRERLSRRELGRRLGLAGSVLAALPVVASILAPTAAQAASCSRRGEACQETSDCCDGCVCIQVGELGTKTCHDIGLGTCPPP
jgi:hypothetical protein